MAGGALRSLAKPFFLQFPCRSPVGHLLYLNSVIWPCSVAAMESRVPSEVVVFVMAKCAVSYHICAPRIFTFAVRRRKKKVRAVSDPRGALVRAALRHFALRTASAPSRPARRPRRSPAARRSTVSAARGIGPPAPWKQFFAGVVPISLSHAQTDDS
jgi:hypothetical protein